MNSPDQIMGSSTALKLAKKELRLLMKQRLTLISKDSISSQSASVFNSLQMFKPYQESKRIGIYLSMPIGEIQTDAIVRHALASGKQVFVPYLYKSQNKSPDTPKSVMDMVDLRSISDYDSLKRDNWGIPTIESDTVDEREHILKKESIGLDMILMPGVAFDIDPKNGTIRRIGHGKGFYDYFLHRNRQIRSSQPNGQSVDLETDVLLYGLALEEQFLSPQTRSSVPMGEHDSTLNGLLVGDGQIVEGFIRNE